MTHSIAASHPVSKRYDLKYCMDNN